MSGMSAGADVPDGAGGRCCPAAIWNSRGSLARLRATSWT